jgi:hypothetical protein
VVGKRVRRGRDQTSQHGSFAEAGRRRDYQVARSRALDERPESSQLIIATREQGGAILKERVENAAQRSVKPDRRIVDVAVNANACAGPDRNADAFDVFLSRCRSGLAGVALKSPAPQSRIGFLMRVYVSRRFLDGRC